MKYYFAPIEGITNYHYRNLHNKYFKGIDKYFIPFLSPNQKGLPNKNKKEIDPTNNHLNTELIPQIISKNSEDTIYLINVLKDLGYTEVNLNFGCPSGTVVPRGRGGGMLKDLNIMDQYLHDIFLNTDMKISVKIRIGLKEEQEFDNILKVLNKYPFSEVIIHPRTVIDYYKGPIHLNVLDDLDKKTNLNIIYNGDIKNLDDIKYIQNRYPFIKGIMIGRGLVACPDLLDPTILTSEEKKNRILKFYNELKTISRHEYLNNNSLYYEKEIWALLIEYFHVDDKTKKKLFKCKDINNFDIVLNEIFKNYSVSKNLSILI